MAGSGRHFGPAGYISHQLLFSGSDSGAVDWVRVTDLDADEVKFFDDFLGKAVP